MARAKQLPIGGSALLLTLTACGPQHSPSPPGRSPSHEPATVEIATPPPPESGRRSGPVVVVRNADFDVAALLVEEGAQQSHTEKVSALALPMALKSRWRTKVGKTTFRSTLTLVGDAVVVGTHGATLEGKGERSDGVYVLESKTGKQRALLRPPGGGDLDVGGVAVDNDRLFFGTDSGLVVAMTLAGNVLWAAKASGKVRPAPALGDLDADGVADVVVGDEGGGLHALEGKTGRPLWHAATATNEYGARGFIGAAAIADLDGDGRDDVVAGARDGILVGYRGFDGAVLWQVREDSGMHASPSVGDFDGDGSPEVLAAWAYSVVGIFDGTTGARRWSQTLGLDTGGIDGLFGSPVPLMGSPGVIVSPTAWWGDEDGVVLVGAAERRFRSFEGRVTSSAVVTDLDGDGTREAILGTEKGAVIALQASGGRALLVTLGGAVEATPLLADVDGDGAVELFVASNDGFLTCFETGSRALPDLPRFRGADPRNRGNLGRVSLSWQVAPPALPRASGIRVDYLTCCQELQRAATRAPSPDDERLLRAAAACLSAAASRTERREAMAQIGKLVPNASALPGACR